MPRLKNYTHQQKDQKMSKTSDEMLINWLQASLDDKPTTETVDDSDMDTDTILNNAWQKIKRDPILIALFYNYISVDQRAFITTEELSNFINDLGNKQVTAEPKQTQTILYAEPECIVNKGQIDTSFVTFARIDRVTLFDHTDTNIKTWKDTIDFILSYLALRDPNKMIEFFQTKSIDLVDRPQKVRRPLPVKNMNLWYESNKSAINIATDINKLIKYFCATDDFEIEYHSKYPTQINNVTNFDSDGTVYHLERTNRETGRVWKATCIAKDGKYVLKSGSIISNIELLGCPKKIQDMRESAKISSNQVLLEDIEFDTLSDAASFVLATNAWGEREWKK